MPDYKIGSWVRRERIWPVRWHLVETDVADDVVTKCGHRMNSRTKTGGILVTFTGDLRPGWIESCVSCSNA